MGIDYGIDYENGYDYVIGDLCGEVGSIVKLKGKSKFEFGFWNEWGMYYGIPAKELREVADRIDKLNGEVQNEV